MLARKSQKQARIAQYSAYGALLLATAIWGAAVPIIKLTLNYLPVFTFLFFRFLVVCVIVLIPLIVELKKNPIDKRDLPSLILLGITGQSAIILIFLAVKLSTALDIAIIGAIAPLMIIVAGHYFYNEKVGFWVKVGVLIATMGTLVIVLEPLWGQNFSAENTFVRILGNVVAVMYNAAFAAYIIISKKVLGQNSKVLTKMFSKIHVEPMKKRYSPFVETALTFYVAFVTIIPFTIAENLGWLGGSSFTTQNINWISVAGVLYMAVLSSVVAYIAFEWGLKKAAATDSAVFSYMGPIFTLPFAYFLLAEVPSAVTITGTFIIAIGVIIAEARKS